MTEVFARLAPGATLEQARGEIGRISSNVYRDHPETYEKAAGYNIAVTPLREIMNERATLTFWLLMGAATFVFLIACANVANLTLIRGIRRERELIVRRAMGAGAARLRKLLLAENLILALAGGALGLVIAYAGLGLLVAFAQQLTTRGGEIRLDGVVLSFTLVIAILVAVLLAFVPNVGAEGSLAASLVSAGKRTTAGRGRQRLQRSLVVVQVAVSVVLLTGAGLLVRTLMKLQVVDTGLGVENVLSMEIPMDGTGRKPEEMLNMYEQMQRKVATLPGVIEVGLGSNVPLRGNDQFRLDVKAESRPLSPGEPTPNAEYRTASPEYFRAARIPLIKGREFATTDRRGNARVVVINQTLAKRLFGDKDPIGQRIAWTGDVLRFIPISGDWRTIVGVVGDTRDSGPDTASVTGDVPAVRAGRAVRRRDDHSHGRRADRAGDVGGSSDPFARPAGARRKTPDARAGPRRSRRAAQGERAPRDVVRWTRPRDRRRRHRRRSRLLRELTHRRDRHPHEPRRRCVPREAHGARRRLGVVGRRIVARPHWFAARRTLAEQAAVWRLAERSADGEPCRAGDGDGGDARVLDSGGASRAGRAGDGAQSGIALTKPIRVSDAAAETRRHLGVCV